MSDRETPRAAVVDVRRSSRRRRTVSAYRDGDRIVVLIPDAFSAREEAEWVATMVARIERSERRRGATSDDDLVARAKALNDQYLGGLAVPDSVRWVDNQQSRWGSCTPGDRSIRLSRRLQGMPSWVIDYVLVHELAHLFERHHNAAFWGWVEHYPHAERAKGYLLGWSSAARLDNPPGSDGSDGSRDQDDLDGFD